MPADFVPAMRRALELARRGEGLVEPNPQVGAVVVDGHGQIVGEGCHERFGGPHAEVMALAAAGAAARGATLLVTLEPCCHHGKTPPCTDAVIAAGISRVVVATRDPFPAVNGSGIAALEAAGIPVETGLMAPEAERLIAPFRTLLTAGRPWVIAKWAMSLDGRIATATGESQWISGEASRGAVHRLRGRMDAILIGIGTALADDPLLTARPAGLRRALRIVVDSAARLPPTSRLVQTAPEIPLLVAVGPDAPAQRTNHLESLGCLVWRGSEADRGLRLRELLHHLGQQRLTNLLVEGGNGVLGSFCDLKFVDEAWAFVAPKLIGGAAAPAPLGGQGHPRLADAPRIAVEELASLDGDVLIRGTVIHGEGRVTETTTTS